MRSCIAFSKLTLLPLQCFNPPKHCVLQATHVNSLKELVRAHAIFKIQVNLKLPEEIQSACQDMASQCGAHLLQLKGKTALFMQPGADVAAILQKYAAKSPSPRKQRKLDQEAVWNNADAPPRADQLKPNVQAQLKFLQSAGIITDRELDKQCLRLASNPQC